MRTTLDELRQLNIKKKQEQATPPEPSPEVQLSATEPASAPPENADQASIYKSTQIEIYTDRNVGSDKSSSVEMLPDRNLDFYTPATVVNIDVEVARRVKEMSQVTEREACNFRLPVGLAARIHRHIGEHYRERIQKGDLMIRAAMLLVYELETGQSLIDFDAMTEPSVDVD